MLKGCSFIAYWISFTYQLTVTSFSPIIEFTSQTWQIWVCNIVEIPSETLLDTFVRFLGLSFEQHLRRKQKLPFDLNNVWENNIKEITLTFLFLCVGTSITKSHLLTLLENDLYLIFQLVLCIFIRTATYHNNTSLYVLFAYIYTNSVYSYAPCIVRYVQT